MAKRIEDIGSGDLSSRVRLEKRIEADDGYGNTSGTWTAQFTRKAYVQMSKGGEAVVGARLEGKSPGLIIVRYDSQTKTIASDWRVVELHGDGTETIFAIHQAQDMERRRRWMTLFCEEGVAA